MGIRDCPAQLERQCYPHVGGGPGSPEPFLLVLQAFRELPVRLTPPLAANRQSRVGRYTRVVRYNGGVKQSFLQKYLEEFQGIEGWFQYDAALMFMAYNQLLASCGVAANVLEIGVHHGRSTIALAALRQPNATLYVIDLFEKLQAQNISRSGGGDQAIFERNVRKFFGDTAFIVPLICASTSVDRSLLNGKFSFCHVDGGHSRAETLHDLELSTSLLVPGGLVALDDYFNPEFPGVCEGAIEFWARHPKVLRPVALAFNKVIFQKTPALFDLNADFRATFPSIPYKIVQLWSSPTLLFTSIFRSYFDLNASTPRSLKCIGADHLPTT